jgi:fucose permease
MRKNQEMSPNQKTAKAKPHKKSFQELFTKSELWLYGTGAIVYIGLGIILQNIVLNFVVGPLFIMTWIWVLPYLIDRWKGRGS